MCIVLQIYIPMGSIDKLHLVSGVGGIVGGNSLHEFARLVCNEYGSAVFSSVWNGKCSIFVITASKRLKLNWFYGQFSGYL